MLHTHSLEEIQSPRSWVTIGVFDGVHRGHQAILSDMVSDARQAGARSVVITFFPHPAVVLGKVKLPSYLTSPEMRAQIMGDLGVDTVVTLPFDLELASLSAYEFMQRLKQHLNPQKVFAGLDFALGRGREGTLARLEEIGQELGYSLQVIQPVIFDGQRISSSAIRDQLQSGQVDAAADSLGRLYMVEGVVIHGDGRGKALGFPTANLDVWLEQLMPASGVYATWTWVGENRYPSVTNLGTRPTFENTPPQPRLETHLLAGGQDLYGKTVRLEFARHIRQEMRFPSIDELVNQVNRDKETAKEILSHAP